MVGAEEVMPYVWVHAQHIAPIPEEQLDLHAESFIQQDILRTHNMSFAQYLLLKQIGRF